MKELIKDKKIAIIDIETSGLYCGEKGKKDSSIIKVDALKIENGHIGECYSSYVACDEKISEPIAHLTGINDETLKDAPACKEVLKELKEFTDGYIIYTRNDNFVNRFLRFYSEKFEEEVNYAVSVKHDRISETLNSPYIEGLLSIYNIEEEKLEVLTYAKLILKMSEEGIL